MVQNLNGPFQQSSIAIERTIRNPNMKTEQTPTIRNPNMFGIRAPTVFKYRISLLLRSPLQTLVKFDFIYFAYRNTKDPEHDSQAEHFPKNLSIHYY